MIDVHHHDHQDWGEETNGPYAVIVHYVIVGEGNRGKVLNIDLRANGKGVTDTKLDPFTFYLEPPRNTGKLIDGLIETRKERITQQLFYFDSRDAGWNAVGGWTTWVQSGSKIR